MNPCAVISDLLPFQGSPFGQLGYFSIAAQIILITIQLAIKKRLNHRQLITETRLPIRKSE